MLVICSSTVFTNTAGVDISCLFLYSTNTSCLRRISIVFSKRPCLVRRKKEEEEIMCC